MHLFLLFYQRVDNEYSDEYFNTGSPYFLGAFSSREKAMDAARADVARSSAILTTREDVPSASEGMVRVDGCVPRGYFFIWERALDAPTFDELGEDWD